MTGKILSVVIVVCALIAGVAMYYLQVYAFYEEVTPTGVDDVQLTTVNGGVETIFYEDFQAIDADSSPIRYRACFTTTTPLTTLLTTYEAYSGAAPRNAPGWFECFDAEAIGEDIRNGRAHVFVSQRNLEFGIDRVVAVTEDGRGYIWHEVNECGDKAYDGSPLGEDCPERDLGGN
ncbi:DUF6446 family protein [Marivita hallyeonensis]|uniref:Histidine kinase n=1 Tax=Marivita hallyeonensis TaxID=996342 RepID=A0A1M5W458_9RHOB|nr:DUF6446 family protein [Marivita hallyeonensis]SHH82228.1 hypothetical protein SAMN05443551_3246 [Marivita hallyeonensis]